MRHLTFNVEYVLYSLYPLQVKPFISAATNHEVLCEEHNFSITISLTNSQKLSPANVYGYITVTLINKANL